MENGGRRLLFAPGRVRAIDRAPAGIRVGPPPNQPPPTGSGGGGSQGRGAGKGQGAGGGRGTGKGQGVGLANLQQLVAALGAISSTSGKVIPSPPLVPAGALVLLSTTTLAADGTFNISGIDQTYTDLVVACKLRGANASATGTVFLTVNSDGGANYQYVSFGAINASSALPGAAASSTNIGLSQINCNTAPAKSFTAFEFTIFNYASTTQNKTMLGQYNQNSSNVAAGIGVFQWSAEWAPATPVAITSLQISRAGSNCLAGSQVRIYGRS